MSLFEIIESPCVDYAALVMAMGVHRPYEDQQALEKALQDRGAKGTVLFDFLLPNASATRRFFAAEFDGERFVNLGWASRVRPPFEVEFACARFYQQAFARLNPCLLSLAQRYCLQQGVVINPSKPPSPPAVV